MAVFTEQHFKEMHHLYRINLINSCSGYKSANLIGTKSSDGITNVAVFSSVTHMGSNPALLGFFLRPTTVLRNTYQNIKATGKYTINHIYEGIIEDAHHTSAKYDSHISEFDVTTLEACYHKGFYPPFVKGCPVQMAMEYVEEYPIHANNTILLVGKIKALHNFKSATLSNSVMSPKNVTFSELLILACVCSACLHSPSPAITTCRSVFFMASNKYFNPL